MSRIKIAPSFLFIILGCVSAYCAEEESALFWPPPPAEMRVAFVKSIYSTRDIGAGAGLFRKLKDMLIGYGKDILNKPLALAVDSSKTIYVCDPGSQALHIFKQNDKRYKKITSVNGERLLSPVGVAAGDEGIVFIADSKLKKVFCLDGEGRFKFAIGGNERFLRPTGLAIYKEKLYIADTAAHRVLIFDLKGRLIGEFGKRGKADGEFNFPTSIAVDNEGKIFVIDALNFRIQAFDRNNKFLYSIGQAGDASGSFSRPKGVAVDSFGHIYVTDGMFDNIQIFNQKREFLLTLGESGHGAGEFWIPCGITIDRDDYIYVADSYNQRIQVFRYVGKE